MQIIEQGFVCKDKEYYYIGAIQKNEKKRIPTVAKRNGKPYYVAHVTRYDSVTKRFVYLKKEDIPEDVKEYVISHNYNY